MANLMVSLPLVPCSYGEEDENVKDTATSYKTSTDDEAGLR